MLQILFVGSFRAENGDVKPDGTGDCKLPAQVAGAAESSRVSAGSRKTQLITSPQLVFISVLQCLIQGIDQVTKQSASFDLFIPKPMFKYIYPPVFASFPDARLLMSQTDVEADPVSERSSSTKLCSGGVQHPPLFSLKPIFLCSPSWHPVPVTES